MLVSVVLISALIIIIGLLNCAQSAFLQARRARIDEDSSLHPRRAASLLRLIENQEGTIAATRVAVTLLVVATSLFAGGPLADQLVLRLNEIGVTGASAEAGAFFSLIAILSLLLVVFGELIPAGIANAYPEAAARILTPSVGCVLTLVSPLAAFARAGVSLVLKPIRRSEAEEAEELEEDIKSLVDEGQRAGVIEAGEKEIINRVFKLDDKPVASLMTPRADVVLVTVKEPVREILAQAAETRHSWFPVRGDSEDDIVGIVSVHDLMALDFEPQKFPGGLGDILVQPLQVPKSMTALKLLEQFRENSARFAVVRDEYGGVAGIVTVYDVLQVIVGDMSDDTSEERSIVEREDGTLLVDAGTDVQELFEVLGLSDELPFSSGEFHSLGGFIMTTLGYVPREGERFDAHGFTFEVIDMDNNRIDKVLVAPHVQRKAVAS